MRERRRRAGSGDGELGPGARRGWAGGGGQAGGSEIPSQASGSDPGHARGSVSSRDTRHYSPPAREPHGAGCDSRHATYKVTPGEPSRHLTLSSHFGITACVPRAVLFIPVTIAQPPFVRLNPFLVFTRPQPSSHLAAIRLFSASLFLFYLFINSVLRMLHISHLVIIFV